MLNISNIPGVTQVRPNMKIVGKVDIEEIQLQSDADDEDSDMNKYNKK